MAIGKQGGIVKPTPYKATTSVKHGGGSGPSGGKIIQAKTPTPKSGNKNNLK